MKKLLALLLLAASCAPAPSPKRAVGAAAAEWHVTTTGTGAPPCASSAPCSLATVMQDRDLSDTIVWLHGGDYIVNFDGSYNTTFRTRGTAGHPVMVRQFPGEPLATLKANGVNWWPAWIVAGQYVWFWGFRVTPFDASNRITSICGSSPGTDMSHYGAAFKVREDLGPRMGIKFINVQMDNNLEGIEAQNGSAPDLEVYGCNIFYNGWWSTCDGDHGHGIYPQGTQSGNLMKFLDVILQDNVSNGYHPYGSAATWQNGMEFVGDVSGNARNATIAGGNVAVNCNVHDSSFWAPTNSDTFHYGWPPWPLGAITGTTFTNNLFAGGLWLQQSPVVTITGNLFRDLPAQPWAGYDAAQYPNNTWGNIPASYKVRPNLYEPGTGSVRIYNPGNLLTFPVDISPIVVTGGSFQVRYALAPQAPPILSGVYSGGTVGIPMSGYSAAPPTGNLPVVSSSLPVYGVFLVTSGGAPSTPSPTLTPTTTRSASVTPSPSVTSTPLTPTASATPSSSPTRTATNTPVFTWTALPTKTKTATKTKTPTPLSICVTTTPVCVKVTVTP